tara:strand:+ start:63 stop:182 length:120 start_codon:yes stop_codon:yes gene_type:complete
MDIYTFILISILIINEFAWSVWNKKSSQEGSLILLGAFD